MKIPLSTVRSWWKRAQEGKPLIRRPGPKPYVPPTDVEHAIRDLFEVMGPEIGVPMLKHWFPNVPRRLLRARLRQYRRAQRKAGHTWMTRLDWTTPGSVWAMDFTKAPNDLGGCGDEVLVVRDLGSAGYPLNIEAMAKDGQSVADCLERLFILHGAPLVAKLDNGFMDERIKEVARRWGVLLLYSPPALPGFNGHVETGMSAIRDIVHRVSCATERPGRWEQSDLAAARLEIGNATTSRGVPADLWFGRKPVSVGERQQFQERHQRALADVLLERELESLDGLDHYRASAVTRQSLTRALADAGLVRTRRVRVPPRPRKNRTLRTRVGEALKAVMRLLQMPISELLRAIIQVRDAASGHACLCEGSAVQETKSPSSERAECVNEPRRGVRQRSTEEAK